MKIDLSTKAALTTTKKASVTTDAQSAAARETPITIENIENLWIRFPSKIKEKYGLHFLFSKVPLYDEEAKKIVIETSISLVAQEMQSIMPMLTKYMRDGLENDLLKIEVKLDETKREDIDMSPKGKATAMAEKNDKLRDLCKRLHLDFA